MDNKTKNLFITSLIITAVISSFLGGSIINITKKVLLGESVGQASGIFNFSKEKKTIIKIDEESAVVSVVENISPAVVSIIVTKDLPIIEKYYTEPKKESEFFRRFFGDEYDEFLGRGEARYRQKGTEKRESSGGSGFFISSEGYLVTNRHVVIDEEAEYTVLMNDESRLSAEVIARDTVNDLAILKIKGKDFPVIEFGDSDILKVGQSVVAIGNALGEFRNTVSTGVISGLSRSVVAGGVGLGSEQLLGLIQTDASINPGNSGGPLLNIAGQLIGINTAMAQGAENIGFAIPANEIRNIYESVRKYGRIIRPWIGVRYMLVNKVVVEKNNLEVDHGALIIKGNEEGDLAVVPGSPADKAGLVENDIILELNGEKIDAKNPFANAINKYKPGNVVSLKVFHKGDIKIVKLKLEEMRPVEK